MQYSLTHMAGGGGEPSLCLPMITSNKLFPFEPRMIRTRTRAGRPVQPVSAAQAAPEPILHIAPLQAAAHPSKQLHDLQRSHEQAQKPTDILKTQQHLHVMLSQRWLLPC